MRRPFLRFWEMLSLYRILGIGLFAAFIGCGLISCNSEPSYKSIQGETMGTYYIIKYQEGQKHVELQSDIEDLLLEINNAVSTYIPTSFISIVNQSKTGDVAPMSDHFWNNLERAQFWYNRSDGYLDPSIMPIVNYWGFGYSMKKAIAVIDSAKVDRLHSLVGLNKWEIDVNNKTISKSDPDQQLDFSSLAKGYALDQIGDYLESKQILNYLIDIGGENLAKGINAKGTAWTTGISTPSSDSKMTDVTVYLQLKNVALATSGNYRNYYEIAGGQYGHTIDPLSGYPYQDKLLSVTVITERCIDADAIATACMAMGLDKARTFIEEIDGVEACFLAGEENDSIATIYSNGFIRYVFDPSIK